MNFIINLIDSKREGDICRSFINNYKISSNGRAACDNLKIATNAFRNKLDQIMNRYPKHEETINHATRFHVHNTLRKRAL